MDIHKLLQPFYESNIISAVHFPNYHRVTFPSIVVKTVMKRSKGSEVYVETTLKNTGKKTGSTSTVLKSTEKNGRP